MSRLSRISCAIAIALLANQTSFAQPTYSIDFQGPTASPPLFGIPGPVSDGDILTPTAFPPGAPPTIATPFGLAGLGLVPTPPGPGPPFPASHGGVEVDALSYGLEAPLEDDPIFFSNAWDFSVDEFAVGDPSFTFGPAPSVTTEGASGFFLGPGFGAMEASADVFSARTAPGLYTPLFSPIPMPLPGLNTGIGVFDGDGAGPFGLPGLNLIEPNVPSLGGAPDAGDNLDAWDADTPPGSFPIYYSLDSDSSQAFFPPYPIDPLEAFPASTGSAFSNGFVGGDVLVTPAAGAAPVVYAPAGGLGLDDIGGPDTDDLDALVLFEDGDGVYTPPMAPFDWLFVPGTDMLLYSVRRGSAIIGVPDVFTGTPITEGDILLGVIDPLDGIPMQDGIDGDIDVGIFVFAEDLGLGTDGTRSSTGSAALGMYGAINPVTGVDDWSDDLNALDVFLIANSADSDSDGDVDIFDLLAYQRGDGSFGPGLASADGEFTGDQIVDALDLSLWFAQFGIGAMPVAAATHTPEPAGLVLSLGLGACVGRRKRR